MNKNNSNSSLQRDANKDIIKNKKCEWWVSWPVIVIACILFWPIGIFLIWKRTSVDKKAALNTGKTISIFGWICLAFAFLGLFVGISEGFASDDAGMILFFGIAGLVLVAFGKYTSNSAKKSRKYIAIVVNQEMTSIDNIAASIPTTYDDAKKDLQKMIDKGYFDGAYINESAREIILPKKQPEVTNNQLNNVTQNITMQSIVCKSCGANNKIAAGTVGECEFCGSMIVSGA